MRKALLALFLTLGMVVAGRVDAKLTCPAFDGIEMSAQDRQLVEDKKKKWENMACYVEVMKRMALYKQQVDAFCLKHGIEPYFFYGIVLVESKGDPDAVDGVFKALLSDKAHVGVCQLNSGKVKIKNPEEVARIANEWRVLERKIRAMSRRIKQGKAEPTREYYKLCARSDELKKRWEILDPRFGIYTNLYEAIEYFAFNYRMSHDYLLAVMAHHGGTYSPIRQVAFYLFGRIGPKEEKAAIEWLSCNEISYFTLRRWEIDNERYWAKKADSHLNYALEVAGATEAFWEFWYFHKGKRASSDGWKTGVPWKLAKKLESSAWYLTPKYNSVEDLEAAAKRGEIIPAPSCLKKYGFVLDDDIGNQEKNKHRQHLYKMAPKATWGMFIELGIELNKVMPGHRPFRISSLVRHKAYMDVGSKTTSHNSGGAADVDMNQSGHTPREKRLFYNAVCTHEEQGKSTNYGESDTVNKRGRFTMYRGRDILNSGMLHIVVNPYKKRHFEQVYDQHVRVSWSMARMITLPHLGQKEGAQMDITNSLMQIWRNLVAAWPFLSNVFMLYGLYCFIANVVLPRVRFKKSS